MQWQDITISVCQVGFFFAMLPTIFGKAKPPFSTCLMNVILVSIIIFSLGTLHLWLSAATGSGTAFVWLIVAIQTRPKKSKKSNR